MAGFETPTAGAIWIDGVDVTAMPPYERPVNMMFQSYALFPHMSRAEERRLRAARQDRVPAREIDDRVAEMLKLVRMEQFGEPHRRTSSPAGSASASRSRARWSSARSSCCSTSRSPRSTRSCASTRSSS